MFKIPSTIISQNTTNSKTTQMAELAFYRFLIPH